MADFKCPKCGNGTYYEDKDTHELVCFTCSKRQPKAAAPSQDGPRPTDAPKTLEAWLKLGEGLAEDLERKAAAHQAEANRFLFEAQQLRRRLGNPRQARHFSPEWRAAQSERMKATRARQREERARVGP